MDTYQSSLTSPNDKTTEFVKSRVDPLTSTETEIAAKVLIEDNTATFARVERRFCDPDIPGQKFSLHSFIPSKGAKPDSLGIYGMIKIRGTYSSIEEAADKAEELVKNHDSYHKIYTGFVGKPMPITESSDFSAKVDEIDIQKEISTTVREDIKAKRAFEKKQVDEIREREKSLKEEVEQEANDPYEKYTCLCVKRAQTIWGYFEHKKKMDELIDVFNKTVEEIKEMDAEDSDYKDKYVQRYKDARERAGIPEDKNDISFMKYLTKDINSIEEFVQIEEELKANPNYRETRTSGSTISVVEKTTPDIPQILPEDGTTPTNFSMAATLK
jgi:hypothetical protein